VGGGEGRVLHRAPAAPLPLPGRGAGLCGRCRRPSARLRRFPYSTIVLSTLGRTTRKDELSHDTRLERDRHALLLVAREELPAEHVATLEAGDLRAAPVLHVVVAAFFGFEPPVAELAGMPVGWIPGISASVSCFMYLAYVAH